MRVRLIDGRRTLEGLLLGGVGTCKRTVGESCLFRAEGDIRQNSPSVQFEASRAQVVSCRIITQGYREIGCGPIREIGRRGWQCLSPRKALISCGKWWILRPIQF